MEEKKEERTLYIPTGVTAKKEFFKGFGKDSVRPAIIGILFTAFLVITVSIFVKSEAVLVLLGSIGFAGSILLNMKNIAGQSVVEIVQHMVSFAGSQKIYPYRYKDEWK